MAATKAQVNNFCEVTRRAHAIQTGVTDYESSIWDLGVSQRELVALLICRLEIDYQYNLAIPDQAASMGIVLGSRDLGGLAPSPALEFVPSTYITHSRSRAMTTSGSITEDTVILDYTKLPGGGILVPVRPLYINSRNVGLGTTQVAHLTMYYQLLELDQANLLDLVQLMIGYND